MVYNSEICDILLVNFSAVAVASSFSFGVFSHLALNSLYGLVISRLAKTHTHTVVIDEREKNTTKKGTKKNRKKYLIFFRHNYF